MTTTKQSRKLIAREAKLKRRYKRARRQLMDHIIWLDPASRMGILPHVLPFPSQDEFEADLQVLIERSRSAFDAWSDVQCRLDMDIPKP